MMSSIRVACLALVLAAGTACGGRAVEVRTAPTVTSDLSVQVTNNLSQALNVTFVPLDIPCTGTFSTVFGGIWRRNSSVPPAGVA